MASGRRPAGSPRPDHSRGVDAADRTTLVEAFARPGCLNGALMAAFANRRDLEVFASVLA
jgi:hypothetical protein